MSLDELAERVEKLTGPCREVDAAIYMAANPKIRMSYGRKLMLKRVWPTVNGGLDVFWYETKNGCMGGIPDVPYTASLDAAMTLVPEGCAWTLYSDGPTYRASAEIGKHPNGGELMQGDWAGEGETPALALCAASLRARALSALGGRSQGGEGDA